MAPATAFGASIVKPQTTDDDILPPVSKLESPLITPAASREDLTHSNTPERRIPTHSPLYQNRAALAPLQPTYSRGSSQNVNEKDIEAGASTPLSTQDENNPFTSKVSLDPNKECTMWPSKQKLMEDKRVERKRKRSGKTFGLCAPVVDRWSRLSKKQRLAVHIVVGLLLIGAIVGIAVGISVSVNGSVYVSEDQTQQIPEPE